MNFRVGLASGTVAALLAAVPAALRVAESGRTWLLLAGAAAALLGPVVAGVRSARPLPLPGRALLIGLGLAVLPSALFVARLQAATHHRPLGAVVIAFGVTALVAGAALISLRILLWARAEPPPPSASVLPRVLAAAAALGPVLLVGMELARGPTTAVLDATLALGACALMLLPRWPDAVFRAAGMVALPLWALLVLTATWLAFGPTRDAASAASPVLFAPLSWVAPRS